MINKTSFNGAFVGKKVIKGIYSPITQNERHLQLLKKIKIDRKKNIITKTLVARFFENMHKSVVVLANPKTVLHTKDATKSIKDKVIRADQLVSYIKQVYNASKESESSDKDLLEAAQSHIGLHQEVELDYTAKYEPYKINKNPKDVIENNISGIEINVEETKLYQALKQYRLQKSREEQVKPYFIYNDNKLKALIFQMPMTLEELQQVQGFGTVKVAKYGYDILDILRGNL